MDNELCAAGKAGGFSMNYKKTQVMTNKINPDTEVSVENQAL